MSLASRIDRRIVQTIQRGVGRQVNSQVTVVTQTAQAVTGTVKSIAGVTAVIDLQGEERTCNLGTKVVRAGDNVVVIGTRVL
jgi:hypothetical protein